MFQLDVKSKVIDVADSAKTQYPALTAWFDPPVYLDRARIFRRFRFSLRIRFLRHFALMVSRAEKETKLLNPTKHDKTKNTSKTKTSTKW